MRLLRIVGGDAQNLALEFEEFLSADVPLYAILSHTWEKEEVSYDDFTSGRGPSLLGYSKIQGCARQARKDKLEYIWVDTCCIDKRSSAELTEAINSMYAWYERSTECYAYLVDVPLRRWEESRWFTRGWTLQELIAPTHVTFYDSEWHIICRKKDSTRQLRKITGIHQAVLEDHYPREFSIAERMSWASKRKTTRVEDIAYCLLGIFDVNMPLLYGEGMKAFRRLQEEIVRSEKDDDSLLAWMPDNHIPAADMSSTVPASSSTTESFSATLTLQLPRTVAATPINVGSSTSHLSNNTAIVPVHDKVPHTCLYMSPFADSPSRFRRSIQTKINIDSPPTPGPLGLTSNIQLIPHGTQKGLFQGILACGPYSGGYCTINLLEVLNEGVPWQPRRFLRVRPDLPSHTSTTTAGRAREVAVEAIIILDISRRPVLRSALEHSLLVVVPSLHMKLRIGDLRLGSSNTQSSQWDFLVSIEKSGKLGAFLYERGRFNTLIAVGLTNFGVPWCKVLWVKDTVSGKSVSDIYDSASP